MRRWKVAGAEVRPKDMIRNCIIESSSNESNVVTVRGFHGNLPAAGYQVNLSEVLSIAQTVYDLNHTIVMTCDAMCLSFEFWLPMLLHICCTKLLACILYPVAPKCRRQCSKPTHTSAVHLICTMYMSKLTFETTYITCYKHFLLSKLIRAKQRNSG